VSRADCFRASACSQIRSTRQPDRRRARVTCRSRSRFAASFFRQKAACCRGRMACRGHACQKQPSTNTASLGRGNTKSGRTAPDRVASVFRAAEPARTAASSVSFTCRRQPVMPRSRNFRTKAPSVRALPRERMRDMTSLRFAWEKMSAMRVGKCQPAAGVRVNSLRPTTPATMGNRHARRPKSRGSPRNSRPNRAVPAAPMPVHTA